MTFQEALKKERRWYRRSLIINLFHKRMLLKKKRWTMRNTAKQLNISLGAVSEGIKLADAMVDKPELEKMRRDEALDWIKEQQELVEKILRQIR